jgi:hypothetical protein
MRCCQLQLSQLMDALDDMGGYRCGSKYARHPSPQVFIAILCFGILRPAVIALNGKTGMSKTRWILE